MHEDVFRRRASQTTAPEPIRHRARQLWQWEGCPTGDVSRYIEMATALVQAETRQGYGRRHISTPPSAEESLRHAAAMIRQEFPN